IQLGRRPTSPVVPAIFGLAIVFVVSGLAAPQIAFSAAAAALVVLRQIHPRELYDAIEWPVIVLLGALIPVGAALEATGATAVLTYPILMLEGQVPIWAMMAMLMIVTMLLSDIMNNAATAIIMAPIAIGIATGLGVSVDPFLMAVAVAASSSYLTPIGHQSNLLVMGPGGYRFADYWRMGLPLDILIVIVAVPLILWVWPL
ncbi:MAG: SLC13 family permease, partial [Alphaproteobacteria bacterium]